MVRVEALQSQISNLEAVWGEAYELLENIDFYVSEEHPQTKFRMDELDHVIRFLLTALKSTLDTISTNAKIIVEFSPQIENINNQLHKISQQAEPIAQCMRNNRGDIDRIVVQGNDQIQSPHGNFNALNHVKEIYSASRQALTQYLIISKQIWSESDGDLSGTVKRFADSTKKIEKLSNDAARSSTEIRKTTEVVQEKYSKIKSLHEEVIEARDNAQKVCNEVNDSKNEADASLSGIKQVLESAHELQKEVDGYRQTFEEYKASIDNQIERINTAYGAIETAKTKNAERETQIDELIEKSDQMIKGTTNVGLAKAFNDASREYGEDAKKAQWQFVGAIILMFASTIPLIDYLWIRTPSSTANGMVIDITGVIARALILLPAIWLTTFTVRRYGHLFQLHREYRFKAAIAMSVDGFKRQAATYAEEIGGAAFVSLSDKPDYGPNIDEDKETSPNFIQKYLIRVLQRKFDQLGQQKTD